MFLLLCRVIWGTNIDGKTSVWHWEVGTSLYAFPYILPLCKFQHSIFHNYTAAINSVSFEKTKVWYLTYLVGSHSVVDDFLQKDHSGNWHSGVEGKPFLSPNTLRIINTVLVGGISVLDDNYIAWKTKWHSFVCALLFRQHWWQHFQFMNLKKEHPTTWWDIITGVCLGVMDGVTFPAGLILAAGLVK